MGYAIRKGTALCLDMGHFHPTESVADKLSAVALSVGHILLHVSRPMRWDSDHVILQNDDLLALAQELVFADLLGQTSIGLDFLMPRSAGRRPGSSGCAICKRRCCGPSCCPRHR